MTENKPYTPPTQHEEKAIFYMVLSAIAGAVIAASIKSLSVVLSSLIAFWFSRLFPLLGLIPMGLHGKLKHLKTSFFSWHLLLNFFYVSSILFYFYSLGFIHLVDASLLFNSAPLYAPIIAILFLKEHFPARLWIYILISFAGVIFILQPGSSLFQPVSLLAALSGVLMAASQICNRHLSQKESPQRIVFYMIILAPILGTIPFLFNFSLILNIPFNTLANWRVMGLLFLAGISSWLYQLYRSHSASLGRVSVVMPFSYLGVVFAGFFDWFFWGVVPNLLTIVGMILIFTGSLFILRHSRGSKR